MLLINEKECLAVASIARDDPSPLPGMHRDHNTLPSQTYGQTDRQADTDIVAQARDVYITYLALKTKMTVADDIEICWLQSATGVPAGHWWRRRR